MQRKDGSGRPKTARTEENIEEVNNLILSQEDAPGTHLTPKEISMQIGVSKSSVRRIAKKI